MYLQHYNLSKKTALVTGAGKGIGKACAIALAEAGAEVIIVSRTKKDLYSVCKTIQKLKKKCTLIVCDVSKYNNVQQLFSQINRLDVLVNNAGTNIPEHFTKVKKEDMDYVVDLNVKAAFNVAQFAAKTMLTSKYIKK